MNLEPAAPPPLSAGASLSLSSSSTGGRRGGGSGRRSPSGIGSGPRLLSRDLPFKQSSNKLNVRNSGMSKVGALMRADW